MVKRHFFLDLCKYLRNNLYMNLPKDISDLNAIDSLGTAFVGLQLFQLLSIIDHQGNVLLSSRGIDVPSRSGSTILILLKEGSVTVTGLARFLGMSHQLAGHRIKDLKKSGFVKEKKDPKDLRRSRIVLSKKGEAAAREIEKISREVETVYAEIFKEIDVDLYDALKKAKNALAARSLSRRMSERELK